VSLKRIGAIDAEVADDDVAATLMEAMPLHNSRLALALGHRMRKANPHLNRPGGRRGIPPVACNF
jgi:hypothetical protein